MRYRWEKVALTGCQVGCALRWSLEFAADCNKEFTASWSPPLARKEPTVQLKERWDVGAAEPRLCCVQRSVTVCGNVPWFHLALLSEGVGLCRVSYEQSQKSPWGIGVVIGVWVSSLSLCSRQSYCLSAVNGAWYWWPPRHVSLWYSCLTQSCSRKLHFYLASIYLTFNSVFTH